MPGSTKERGGSERPAEGGRNIRKDPSKSTSETPGFGRHNRALAPQLRLVAGWESPTYKRGPGEVPEWSIGTVSKTVVRASVPWVRIPPSPPFCFALRATQNESAKPASEAECPPKPWRRRAVTTRRYPPSICSMIYVYMLRSDTAPDQCYVGLTTDLKRRFADHNAGRSAHTSKFRPWNLVTYVAFFGSGQGGVV